LAPNKIIFFDGYCTLCNGFVWILIKLDKRAKFKFATLQQPTAAQYLGSSALSENFNTVIYLRDGIQLRESKAVIYILSDLGGFWSLSRLLLIVPQFLRDKIYQGISQNRFRFAKKKEHCRVPLPSEKSRFLDF
jgi:predicted DCC family thiol-disulfide oxidoreductase YuxK